MPQMLIHKSIHNPVIGVNVNISACLWSDQFHAYLATSRRLAVLPAIHRKDFMLLAEQQILEEKNRTEILELFPKTEWYLEWYNYGAHTNPASYVSTRIRYWGRNWSKYTDLSENYWAIPKRFYSVCHIFISASYPLVSWGSIFSSHRMKSTHPHSHLWTIIYGVSSGRELPVQYLRFIHECGHDDVFFSPAVHSVCYSTKPRWECFLF